MAPRRGPRYRRVRTQPLAGELATHGLDNEIADWMMWRKRYAPRVLQPLARTGEDRPGKRDQAPWTSYCRRTTAGVLFQEWLLVPMWVPEEHFLVSNKADHALWVGPDPAAGGRYPAAGGRVQHFTNIRRVRELAMAHPLIEEVEDHKADKGNDATIKDQWGRASKGHQSEHDLRFTLAATGATMRCGVSVHNAADDLLSLWWAHGPNLDDNQLEIYEAVFHDAMEA